MNGKIYGIGDHLVCIMVMILVMESHVDTETENNGALIMVCPGQDVKRPRSSISSSRDRMVGFVSVMGRRPNARRSADDDPIFGNPETPTGVMSWNARSLSDGR
ncbi:uncharacterized protein CTRU02_205464 [Colletotrichum truncatum]|uniref:Uncharacterized protein n=1 Tax=Colletotrichum truncatum TaxID=5467 RepID=A0ACC3Z436_COLTU|nr:uncharacterized protein CTRU02_04520 [Colletotrichum truncatum]KAF6795710.1 hypothetical protein CTRU02_04520 [Colletotrichum truncatum]